MFPIILDNREYPSQLQGAILRFQSDISHQ